MPHFRTKHDVNHSAENMFALVRDIESYPQFVPLCQGLVLRGQTEKADGSSIIIADMTVAYKMFHETFSSRVTLNPKDMAIDVDYLDGPFKMLENTWRFNFIGEECCEVEFSINYEFKSRTFSMLMGTVFDKAFRRFADAFKARADEIYGENR